LYGGNKKGKEDLANIGKITVPSMNRVFEEALADREVKVSNLGIDREKGGQNDGGGAIGTGNRKGVKGKSWGRESWVRSIGVL